MKQIISDAVRYLGVDDKTLDLFESQYPVPNGVSYNSYLILDEKTVVMDTVDSRAENEWMENLTAELGGRSVDYLVVSHMEPDHGACVKKFMDRYPDAKIVGNAKTFGMISQFFDFLFDEARQVVVKEGETLSIGAHTLQFFMAPFVHWPEVMVTYEQTEKILFSADGFGTFGTLDIEADWAEEAARYYLNIVGKYGVQVQALLKKTENLDIQMICPLHGPILKENLDYYVGKYRTWSSYEPEIDGVLIACASIHGNTKHACLQLEKMFHELGEKNVEVLDLTRTDMSLSVRKAFAYDRMVVAAATYDGGAFPVMEEFLHHLSSKHYQKRTVGIMENGSWAPVAAKAMRGVLETMKAVELAEPVVSIRSAVSQASLDTMKSLAESMAALR